MKVVSMKDVTVVKNGLDWPFAKLPSGKDMIHRLERNESYVSWLIPANAEKADDMFPAIRVSDVYYTLSLRMMKAIWRHVRLRKGFVNMQIVPYVGKLPRIPRSLLEEKMRTQDRFNVSCVRFLCYV